MTESDQRSVLITGCSSGIGRCVALGLKQRGYRVFATARRAADVAALQAEGLESLPLDLADPRSIHQAMNRILERTDARLYALFNNGGYGQPGAVEDLSRDALRAQFETNLFGWVELTNRAIAVMRAQGGGRIIFNSSVLGFVPLHFRGAYVASKYAVEGIADTLRLELRGSGVHVSLIEPGAIETRFRANAYTMYRRHIDPDHSVHREAYKGLEKRLLHAGAAMPFTLPPEAVLKKVLHALESHRPKARYRLTAPTHLFAALKRMLPTTWLDAILSRAARGTGNE